MSNYKSNLQTNNSALSANNIDLQSLIEQANNLPDAGGVELPTLTNEGTASDLLSGKQLIDQEGNVVTGVIPILTEDDIMVIENVIMIPNGYFEDSKTEMDVPLAEQATPSIAISSAGLITASATQSAGYVRAGTTKGTKQLTTKAAITYTPSTTNQTIASGTYLTGTQTIKGDSNLISSNIKSGVSIFGVAGSYVGAEVENLDEELATQDTLITSIQSKLDGDIGLNVCTVTFPNKNMDETIYYTGPDFQLHSHTAYTGSSANGNDTIGHGTISVIKGSIIYSNDLVFGAASVYLTDVNENINIINQQAISVHRDITFSYADNAPV